MNNGNTNQIQRWQKKKAQNQHCIFLLFIHLSKWRLSSYLQGRVVTVNQYFQVDGKYGRYFIKEINKFSAVICNNLIVGITFPTSNTSVCNISSSYYSLWLTVHKTNYKGMTIWNAPVEPFSAQKFYYNNSYFWRTEVQQSILILCTQITFTQFHLSPEQLQFLHYVCTVKMREGTFTFKNS